MSDNNNQGTGFSEEYVKELRQENASWRTKVRDLEQQLTTNEVKTELLKHGVTANPQWVELNEGEDPASAVSRFLEAYPQFSPTNNDVSDLEVEQPRVTKPMSTNNSNTNHRGPKPKSGSFGGRNLEEIKKDPKARSGLRNMYRQLLAQQSNKIYNGE